MATPKYICTTCGFVGKPKNVTKGSFMIELILWLAFLIPGIIYSIWRTQNRQQTCPVCKNTTMIPVTTPTGQHMLKQQEEKGIAPVSATEMLGESNKAMATNILIGIVVVIFIVFLYIWFQS